MTHVHSRLLSEMLFHRSVVDGLSEESDMVLWSLSAGNSRGLLLANECFETGTESEGVAKLQSMTQEAIEKHNDPNDAVVPSPSSKMERNLSIGYLQGLGRAWAIVNEDRECREEGPPKDLSKPRHKRETEVN